MKAVEPGDRLQGEHPLLEQPLVIAEAQRRFPGQPIKAAITTSDVWPHLGGVREYVARGIPVYALDTNLPILNRLLDAPFRTNPDSLARSPRKPDFRVVSGKTEVGSGANRMEIYPIRSETGERQMMVYFPELKVLYASDLAQPAGSGDWTPTYYDELRAAVERAGVKVDTLFAMHMTPVPWSDILAHIGDR